MKDSAVASFAAIAIASNVFSNMPLPAQAYVNFPGTSTVVSEKVVREGMYRDYEVDLVQQYDDARSTYKPAKETKSNKGTVVHYHLVEWFSRFHLSVHGLFSVVVLLSVF